MPQKTLYVRIKPKAGVVKFFRCGIQFTRSWQKLVDLDEATARRLDEEQMLDTSETKPNDYVDPDAATGAPAAPVVPTDPAERAAAIKDAIAKLAKDDAALWTGTGMPKVPAIAAVTGWEITQQERDAVWTEIKAAQ